LTYLNAERAKLTKDASGEAEASNKHATCGASVKRSLFNVLRRLVMSSKHNAAARLFAVFTLATLSLATVAEAQMYGQEPGQGGGMMGGNWGWGMGSGMGGYGGIGVLVLALVVLGIAVLAFRRRGP
jgi:hypothetical protein